MDGDDNISIIQALENAYELIQPVGYICADDYGRFEGCMKTLNFFKQSLADNEPLYFYL